MKINKADLVVEGQKVRVSMPMTKIDTENRIVSGWASLDNVDTQGDIVLAEANRNAFANFRGNIREMHQPVAVGKMVNFSEDVYFDASSNSFYNGIYVDVFVSKGAQNTWEKVLDGTLTGFSIGGNIVDAETIVDKSANGRTIRVVKDYELVELSLVDSPANQLANVLSIHKTAAGTFVDGFIADTNSESVFYCKEDGIAKTSNDDEVKCPQGHKMENIGWIEYDNDDTKTTKVAEVVTKHNKEKHESSHEQAKQEVPATNEGGVDVAEDNEKVTAPEEVAPVQEGATPEGVKTEDAVAANVEETEHVHTEGDEHDETEKAADVSEVEVEEPDFAKMFGDLTAALEAGLTKTREEVSAEVTKSIENSNAKISELAAKHEELVTKFDSLKEELTGVSKTLEVVNSQTAVKKSSDLGGSTEDTLEKSTGSSKWGGVFAPVNGRRFLSVSDIEGSN